VTAAAEPRAVRRETPPVVAFLARRIAGGVIALLIASVVIFAALNVLPGDPASVILGRNATPAAERVLNKRMQLDRPAATRYADWLSGFVHGDLGTSAVSLAQGQHQSVWSQISGPLRNSAILAAIAALFMIPLSIGLGVVGPIFPGRPADHAISVLSLAAIALPEFVTGSLLIGVFYVALDWLPPVAIVPPGASPLDKPSQLVLPVLTLLFASLAAGVRMVRAGMTEVLQADYVQTARLNGVAERRVLARYALRNALAPSVQVIAQNLQWLIGGIIITENVFAYPGIGTVLVDAVQNRDITVVQSVAMLIAVVYVVLNLLADLVVMMLVPKLREPA
jgi:peptide/nickel transport system permease protein